MKFIFGLGNPGIQYKQNRHNIGYRIVEKIAETENSSFKRKFGLGGLIAITKITTPGESYCFIKPTTFMNNSGRCLKAAKKKYGFSLDDILVVYDDVDLELGVVKFKKSGSSGGHRGMQSIVETLGTDQINRLRVGIGRDSRIDTADYVLSDFSGSELKFLPEIINKAAFACCDWVSKDAEFVMQKYNSTKS
ncbi:MAG: aminoacyl-tRNA hydrolase [Candidatus Omnitrophica bacterium]|nr:aminoacyl-tRNA hydrolase [Candidatus Omnitrophota bacterium]